MRCVHRLSDLNIMAYIFYNPNPDNIFVEDCVIRAICKVTNQDWETVYLGVVTEGLLKHNMPSINSVWGGYLYNNGFTRHAIPNTCPDCYTIADFAYEHPKGKYVLTTGSHAVAVVDGNYYDTWDSGNNVPMYYWRKE